MQARVKPAAVTIARESRGLLQSRLAELLGIAQGTISKIEAGLIECSPEILEGLVEHLKYPHSFFLEEWTSHSSGTASYHHVYRRRQSLSAKDLRRIEAQVNIVRSHLTKLLKAVELEAVRAIPRLNAEDFENDGVRVARMVRANWMIPSGPIQNLTELVENAGGIVIPFDFQTDLVDATSLAFAGLPDLFFLNCNLTGDSLRFSLAHELGHMVMHTMPSSTMEDEANAFASEFLMPAAEIGPSLTGLDLPKAAQLKKIWKVSMASLIKRAHTLGKLSDRQYQRLWMQMGATGIRSREPKELDVAIETPRLHKQLVDLHFVKLNYSPSELARALSVFESDFRLLHGLDEHRGLRLVQGFKPALFA